MFVCTGMLNRVVVDGALVLYWSLHVGWIGKVPRKKIYLWNMSGVKSSLRFCMFTSMILCPWCFLRLLFVSEMEDGEVMWWETAPALGLYSVAYRLGG